MSIYNYLIIIIISFNIIRVSKIQLIIVISKVLPLIEPGIRERSPKLSESRAHNSAIRIVNRTSGRGCVFFFRIAWIIMRSVSLGNSIVRHTADASYVRAHVICICIAAYADAPLHLIVHTARNCAVLAGILIRRESSPSVHASSETSHM